MTCEIRIEAYKIIHHLHSLVPDRSLNFEMRDRVQQFLKKVHTTSEMCVHAIEDEVFLDPQCQGKTLIPCKVIGCYRVSDGRVLYDLVAQLGVNEDGTPFYGDKMPMRDIVPSFIRSKKEGEAVLQSKEKSSSEDNTVTSFDLTK